VRQSWQRWVGRAGTRRRLTLHVGLPKSGSSFLQALLAENREALRDAGHVYPFIRREGMFHAAVELRGHHERWGLDHALVDGTWERMLARVRGFDGAGIISHEILSGALLPQVERVARDTADLDLHVVVTARDLARQATAHWQEEVKNGRPWSFAEFERALWEPGESAADELGFWRHQDLAAVLGRWGSVVPASNLHLVVVPQSGGDPGELWRRFAAALAMDPAVLEAATTTAPTNESLGAAQVALLRRVVTALDGRLGQPHYAHVVKRFFAQRQLAPLDARRPVTPEPLRSRLREIARGWLPAIEAAGYDVHWSLAELVPPELPADAVHPDDVTAEELLHGMPDVLASLLLEVASLRGQVPGSDLPPLVPAEPLPAGPGRKTGPRGYSR
jgi:hypothetical protein